MSALRQARVEAQLGELARSMGEGSERVDAELRALAAESRIHGARLDRVVARLRRSLAAFTAR